ncbi:MAG: nucleotidyltransferase family protein [Fibrella sp.]|nr:nucleotidyltransferase family protein [Armatimonadota bacterium]
MDEKQVVQWAAGTPLELEESSLDDDRLLRLLRTHRLEVRFWDRARNTKLPWCMKRLFLKILPRCNQIRKSVQERIALTDEMVSVLESTDKPVITLKGFTTYALTGQERNQRYSSDLDVMFSDLPYLVKRMETRGFQGGKKQWASHEYSALKRGEATIEPHRFFPVYSYPDSLPGDLVPENNPGRWTQRTFNRRQSNIGYEDLLAHSQFGIAPSTRHLTVANPSMAVFILCTHEFRDYLQRPCRLAVVHLCALADIGDLTRHPDFDETVFLQLVEKFHGQDSVRLVRYLCRSLLQTDPFPFFGEQSGGETVSRFPQLLNYKGGWALLDERPDDGLTMMSTATVVDRLAAESVSVPVLSGASEAEARRIDRVLIQTMDNADSEAQDIRFEVAAWIDETLRFEITLLDPLEIGFNHQFKLYSNDGINDFHDVYVLAPPDTDDTLPQLGQAERANVFGYWKNAKCAVQFSLPQKFDAGAAHPMQPFAVILMIGKWRWDRAEIFESASPVVIAPLWLVPSAAESGV